jgi:DinB superfamily
MNPYHKYIEGKDPMTVLTATPQRLRELSDGLSGSQLRHHPAPGKWSIHEIVAHLADCELMFSARCRYILYEENKPLIGFDQDRLMSGWRREQESFEDTLERFRVMRQAQLRMFRAASPEDLARAATHEEYGQESASDYLFKVAGHDLNHLEQIVRLRQSLATQN